MKSHCEICGRMFISKKAVHGHMRSHPESTQKGVLLIQQPPSSASSSAASGSSPLPRWSVTAKRGRKSTTTSSSSSSSVAAVDDLMFLSKSAPNFEEEDTDLDDNNNMGELYNPKICETGTKKKKSRAKKMEEIGNQFTEFVAYDHQINHLQIPKKLYRCNSCNKEFSSHQALGGHKSSHNKVSKTTTLLLDLSHDQMGQRRRVLDFDLNELPPEDDGEDRLQ